MLYIYKRPHTEYYVKTLIIRSEQGPGAKLTIQKLCSDVFPKSTMTWNGLVNKEQHSLWILYLKYG